MNKQKLLTGSLLGVIVLLGSLLIADTSGYASGCDPAFVLQEGNIITVLPTGVDDTSNIQCAFDMAVLAGPGSTVQLVGGTYHTSFIEVKGFDGWFKGTGQDDTVITSLPNLPCQAEGNIDLLSFLGGNIKISDLAFHITEYAPCLPWYWLEETTVLHGIVAILPEEPLCDPPWSVVNSSFDKVGFKGAPGSELGRFNVHSAIWYISFGYPCVDWLGGTHSVTNSTFEDYMTWGIVGWYMRQGQLTIGGNPSAKNKFENLGGGIFTSDYSYSNVEISHNEMSDVSYYGISTNQGLGFFWWGMPLPESSDWLISNNKIHAIEYADGVVLSDYASILGEEQKLNAIVSQNKIVLENTQYGGLWGYGARNVLVSNNLITGTGVAGIYMGVYGEGDIANNWTLLGNNVQNLNTYVAPIWLGPGTSNCTVVGGSVNTNVWDFGTDNILVGVNNMQGNPPGPDILEAMQQKMEIIKPMR